MLNVPAKPKIYHITHLRNLSGVVEAGQLWSDAKRIELGLDCEIVGMSVIKQKRLEVRQVDCHPGTKVGEYVPFYFCPRSIMLYILHKGNSRDINYTEGQEPLIHLQADLHAVIQWAEGAGRKWAFSDRNASAVLATFFNHSDDLNRINWQAVAATNFQDIIVFEGKQAEFLMFESFPWSLVKKIGVANDTTLRKVEAVLADTKHRPPASIESGWYY